MTTELMHRAAELLRTQSATAEDTAAWVLAVSAFQALCGMEKPTASARTSEEFMDIARRAADVLSPICPHCQGRLTETQPTEPT